MWLDEGLLVLIPLAVGAGAGALTGHLVWGLVCGLAVAVAIKLFSLWYLSRLAGKTAPPRINGWLERGMSGRIAAEVRRIVKLEAAQRNESMSLRRELIAFARAMPDAAIVIDAHGSIQWANPASERWLGIKMAEDLGRPLVQLIRHPELVERLGVHCKGGSFEMSSPVAPETELMVQVSPYRDGRILVLARDVTHLKRLERMRRDFVANVSHELKSPLTVVAGYVELLADDPNVPSEWLPPISALKQQVSRMSAIVQDLLVLARLESEARPPQDTPVNVSEMLRRVKSQFLSSGIEGRTITLGLQTQNGLLGAELELESAVTNLISNAVKYTAREGRVTVVWQLKNGKPTLSVEDDGIGIPERDIPRLTERFYRVDKGRSAQKPGTGLGLAIVKHVAERHGGKLYIESQLGGGSRFTLVFPKPRVHLMETDGEPLVSS